MAWLLTEPLVDALGDYVAANVAAKVSALNTEYGDGNDLVAFASNAYHFSEKDALSLPSYPALVILETGAQLQQSSVVAGNGQMQTVATVALHVLETGTSSEWSAVRQRLFRWRRALVEMVVAAEPSSLGGWNIAGGPTFPQPGALTLDSQVVDSASVQLTFTIREAKA